MGVIGIDVGGTWVKARRFTDTLEVAAEERVRSGAIAGKKRPLV